MVSGGDDILASHHSGTRYLALGASAFGAEEATNDQNTGEYWLASGAGTFAYFNANVELPHGAVVTSFKVYWYRNVGGAVGGARLDRVNFIGSHTEMAVANSNATSGNHSVEDTTIGNDTIDNLNYTYNVRVLIDNFAAYTDCLFRAAVITYTVAVPLP